MYFSENFRSFRTGKGMTQEDVADRLGITPQSVSKWERGETYPDITFLPAIAMIFDTSIDRLIGMDAIRSVEVRWDIHNRATNHLKSEEFDLAEKVYREALIMYPNKPGMILGLAGVLAMKGDTEEAIALIEKGLPESLNEKQKATMRAVLCFLYSKSGRHEEAAALAYQLPHMRECREIITPVIASKPDAEEIDRNIRILMLGE